MSDLISRQGAIDDIETVNPSMPLNVNWVKNWVKTLPPAQPELIERTAYIRGFEQGRTQGMIDAQGGKNMIKAEWTNADTLDLQPTCNQLATDCISRQGAIDEIKALYEWHDTVTEDRTIDHLKRLPSAQPEGIKYVELSEEDYEKMAEQMRKSPLMLISAQPEVIRCKDCKWHEGRYYCLNFNVFGFDYNDYCSLAERRTDGYRQNPCSNLY